MELSYQYRAPAVLSGERTRKLIELTFKQPKERRTLRISRSRGKYVIKMELGNRSLGCGYSEGSFP
jgi:hypothetical protein